MIMQQLERAKKGPFLTLFVILATLFRILLASNMSFNLIVGSEYDDWLQMRQIDSLLSGNWLGDYNRYILCKNISFPLLVASFRRMGISYGTVLGWLICFSAGCFVLAARPILNTYTAAITYLVIIYTPVSLGSISVIRIYRNAFVPWILLIVIGGEIGIFLRIKKGLIKTIPWMISLFISVPLFWHLREDSVWIIPLFTGIAIACIINCLIYRKDQSFIILVIMFMVPVLGIITYRSIVSEINFSRYGVRIVTDRVDGAEAKVDRLLYQIDDGENLDSDVWVSRASLELARGNSPTLNSLNNLVETYENWGGDAGWPHGDLVTWSLRECAYQNGLYYDAEQTQEFYYKVADELEQAFYDGRLLKKKVFLAGTIGAGVTKEDLVETVKIVFLAFPNFAMYYKCDFGNDVIYIDTDESNIKFAEGVLGCSLPRTDEQIEQANDKSYGQANGILVKKKKTNACIRMFIVKIYRFLSVIVSWISVISYILLTICMIKRTKVVIEYWLIATAGILAAFTNLFTVVLAMRWLSRDVMGNPYAFYAPSVFILLLIFKAFSIYGIMQGYYISNISNDDK